MAHTSGEAVAGTDLLVLAVAVALFAPSVLRWSVAVFVLAVLAVCALRGQYASRITLSVSKDAGTLAVAVTVPLMVIAVFDGFDTQVRPFVLVGIASLCLLLLGRACAYAGIRRARTKGAFPQRVLIVGAGQVAERFADVLEAHPSYGLHPIGLLDDCADDSLSRPVLGGIDQLDDVLRKHHIDRVVLAFGVNRDPDLVRVIRSCENADVDMHVVPRFFELGLRAAARDVDMVWGFPLVRLRRSTTRSSSRRLKRAFDSGISAVMLLVTAPLFALLALGVKLSSPGPVYFRQRRIGKNGREVEVLKFRSMRVNDESDTQWSVDEDAGVTKIGRFMRKTSLDELPQLWNVLRGDMSLVGPRPERPYFVERFEQEVPRYGDRHRVPVGLTGLAQVSGLRGDTSIQDRAWMDNHYIENWSVGGDLAILARTAGAMIKQVRD
ncbi:MAG: sugar transferase [Acidimicrobiales bacterium]|jgi:exopolysaccharide biosynthesis polyprenyl glycosylphosphotransferase